jgi:predicted nucleic acid-binding protein
MILVDSSVWIDYFNGIRTPQTDKLDELLGKEPLALGDLILTEVLQGFRLDKDYRIAKRLLTSLTVYGLLGQDMVLKSAGNYRLLRKKGITIRKTADVTIATFCIERDIRLLHSDRNFDPFVAHLGLRTLSSNG